MLSPTVHADRRARLSAALGGRPVLLMGNGPFMRNLPLTRSPFRQDSNFLYFTGCTRPRAATLIEAGGRSTLFLVPPDSDDPLWHGYTWTVQEVRDALGFDEVQPLASLEDRCAAHGQQLAVLAIADGDATRRAAALAGQELKFGDAQRAGTPDLLDAIIALRRTLQQDEVQEMRRTAQVTAAAHVAAMGVTAPGVPERHVAALFDAVVAAAGLQTAYKSIVTVRGEVLHNETHDNICQAGQLMLLDGGAEARSGYATDVTRTWPVSGRFDARQRSAYDAVLDAQVAAIERVRPGVRYREVHMTACRVLARWLVDEGLLRGDPEGLVERGAHAVFFPHGVGHLIGLDVHDMEGFGDRPAYPAGRSRSDQFGTAYLRLDVDLEPGMCVTVEPGFYVVPAILADNALMDSFGGDIDRSAALAWEGFGGIRIEDDVLCTANGPDVLTAAVPKSVAALEARVGQGEDLLGRLLG